MELVIISSWQTTKFLSFMEYASMPRTEPFDMHRDQYEQWFIKNSYVFNTELAVIRKLLPKGTGVEIGVGTGLFAERLGITYGVEPSAVMARLALERGIHVCRGVAEDLPYHDGIFDFALMVTTICFVDDPRISIKEMARIVKSGGSVIIAFVDKNSSLGKQYECFKENNVFYKDADFYSTKDILHLVESIGLVETVIRQTVFGELKDIDMVQASQEGFGNGGFVVLAAKVP